MIVPQERLSAIAASLVDEFDPLLLLLVGSQALGYADLQSDVDLILIAAPGDSVVQRVEHRQVAETDIALEIYNETWVASLVMRRGLECARELNRLRYGKILHDAGGWAERLIPTRQVVRQVVGDVDNHFADFEALLLDARHNLQRAKATKAALQSECAANVAAILLTTLSRAGEPPYSKPKWLRTAVAARCDHSLVELYEAASFGEGDTQIVAQNCESWLNTVSALLPAELLQEDRTTRRLLWLARKHARDAVSIALRGWAHARSPSLVSASCGLGALCRQSGDQYQALPDAADLLMRNRIPSADILLEALFPHGSPSLVEAKERFNAAVQFCIGCYGLVKAD